MSRAARLKSAADQSSRLVLTPRLPVRLRHGCEKPLTWTTIMTTTRRDFLAISVSAAVAAASTTVSASSTHPDAALIALGAELDRVWALEKAAAAGPEDAACDAYRQTDAVVQEIAEYEATTLAGLRVKGMAWMWCRGGDFAWFEQNGLSEIITDCKLERSLMRDLLTVGA